MKNHHALLATSLIVGLFSASAQAALSANSSSFSYSQSFDSLATTGTSNAWVNDLTLAGWSLFSGTSATPVHSYRADTGASNAGAFYSFGAANSTERALGSIGSASLNDGYIALAVTNNSGAALQGFKLSFDGEQWRNGGNTTAQTMVFQYGFGSSFTTVAHWNTPGAGFNFSSPVATATAGAIDGNGAGLKSGLGGEQTSNWAAGDTLWLRWVEKNDAGNDHAQAIDNLKFSVIAAAVPEPKTYALLLAGLGVIAFVSRRRQA